MCNETDKSPRIAFFVTSARVQHYHDVVEYMTRAAVEKCKEQGWTPSSSEIESFKREVIRYAVIRHDMETATKLNIKKQEML